MSTITISSEAGSGAFHRLGGTDFSRFVVFQIGADTYTSTSERKMALGNETGLIKEWSTQWGGNSYRTAPLECSGRIPWISLHEGELKHLGKAAQERIAASSSAPGKADSGAKTPRHGSQSMASPGTMKTPPRSTSWRRRESLASSPETSLRPR